MPKTADRIVSIYPYFAVHDGKLEDFHNLCERFVERTSSEDACLYYGFTFNGNQVHCREAYTDAAALLTHLQNVGDLLEESQGLADIARLEIHGLEEELAQLREPLKDLPIEYFALEYGIRK